MSPEINVFPRTLALRTNGTFSLTERGHLAHELVRIYRMLKSDADPGVEFAMSEEQRQKSLARKEELCLLIGLPQDEKTRERTIWGFDGRLKQMDIPYYRIKTQ